MAGGDVRPPDLLKRLTARYERARLSRYLRRGGVLFRDEAGGAVGVRWTRAALTGGAFDPADCERRRAAGLIRPVRGSRAAFELTPPPQR